MRYNLENEDVIGTNSPGRLRANAAGILKGVGHRELDPGFTVDRNVLVRLSAAGIHSVILSEATQKPTVCIPRADHDYVLRGIKAVSQEGNLPQKLIPNFARALDLVLMVKLEVLHEHLEPFGHGFGPIGLIRDKHRLSTHEMDAVDHKP